MEMPENLTELMEGGATAASNNKSGISAADKENDPGNASAAADADIDDPNPRAPEVFMLSSVAEEEKEVFAKFLAAKTANGKYSNTNSCDPEATHIIAQKLGRYEC